MTEITTEELVELKNNDEDFVLIGVLGEDYFDEEHIPGAINIPYEDIAAEALDRFDKDQMLVVYCKNTACTASPEAAEKLDKIGFKQVYDYDVGLEGWKDAGHETESN